jgi:hypothetical protein
MWVLVWITITASDGHHVESVRFTARLNGPYPTKQECEQHDAGVRYGKSLGGMPWENVMPSIVEEMYESP